MLPTSSRLCCIQTVKKVPRTVRFNFSDAITHVGDVSGTGTIPIVDSNAVQWLPYDKYTKNKMKAYMIEDYIYIYNADGLKYINVRGYLKILKTLPCLIVMVLIVIMMTVSSLFLWICYKQSHKVS